MNSQNKSPVNRISKSTRSSTIWFDRFPARGDGLESLGSWRSIHFFAARLAPSSDLFPFTAEERRAHSRRSLQATLITFAVVATLFALFFGLIAACGWF